METPEQAIVEALWARFRTLARALHRQDRLETARAFPGWLEALPEDAEQIGAIASSLVLRTLAVASEPANVRILRRLDGEAAVPVARLGADLGLSRVPLYLRMGVLLQAGLVVQELESEDARCSDLGTAVLSLLDALQTRLADVISERLPEVVD